ncbi:MAG: hypothetical protein ABIU55_00250 [Ferruginibacter sp.]
MKKLFVGILALSALTFTATAQQQRETKARKEHKKEGMQRERMQDLNLTEAQKAQLKSHREAMKAKADAIKSNTALTEEQRRSQLGALHETERTYMQSILTADQKAKLAEAKANHQQHMDGMNGDGMKGDGMRKGGHNGEGHKKMQTELNLNNDQAEKLKAIHMDSRDKMKAIKDNTSLSETEKKAQMKALHDQTKSHTESILTKEQIEKKQAMKKDHKRKGHGDRKMNKSKPQA